jgi:hypothetical protein
MASCLFRKEIKAQDATHPSPQEEYAVMEKCVERAGGYATREQTDENVGTLDAHVRICVTIYSSTDDDEVLANEAARIVPKGSVS